MSFVLRHTLALLFFIPFVAIGQTVDFDKLELQGTLMMLKDVPYSGLAVQEFRSPDDEVVLTYSYDTGKRTLIEVEFTREDVTIVKGSFTPNGDNVNLQSFYPSGAKQFSAKHTGLKGNGETTTWHENGNLRSHSEHANGIQQGAKKEFHENGKLKSEEYYVPDIDRRVLVSYDESGQEVSRDTTSKAKPNFDQIFGSNDVDILAFTTFPDSSIGLYYDGLQQYRMLTCQWFGDGTLQQVRVMLSKENVSIWNSWYPTGQPHFAMQQKFLSKKMKMTAYSESGMQMGSGTIIDGEFNGKSVSYYESGQKSNETRFKHGEKHGKTETWYENGQLKVRSYYLEGKLNGKNINWTEDGVKVLEENYADGEKEGMWESWHKNGKRSRRGLYEDDIQTGMWSTWDTAGTILETVVLVPDSNYSVKTVYWQNGKRRSEQSWMNQNKVDVWIQWYREGEKLSEHTYEHNVLKAYTYWHLNGKVKSKYTATDEGGATFQAWHDNGQLSDEGQYDAEGRKTGEWKSWNPDGSKLATVIYDKDAVVKEEWH